MKFSCLIPVFNTLPHHLFEAINSVVNQTVKPNEIVVIDDGSDSKKTIAALAAAVDIYGIKLYRLETNQGISAALNFGIDKCQYDWIARMDADDISFPDRFEKQIKFLKKNPNTDVLGTSLFFFRNNDPWRKQFDVSIRDSCFFDPNFKPKWYWCVNHGTAMYQKGIFSKVKYNVNIKRGQDVHLWADILRAGFTIRNIPDILYAYRRF